MPHDVLVVDDSMSARFALTRSLQPHGLNIETAKSAEEALETAGRSRFDLIFMDHVLPGMTGLDAAEKIRGMDGFADTPIIMCSSNEGDDYVEEALRRGANDVIGKPAEESALNRIIDKYLSAPAAPEAEVAEPVAEEPLSGEASAPSVEPEPPTAPPTTAIEEAAEPAEAPAASPQEVDTMSADKLAALDARIDRLETMLERLEATVGEMDSKTEAAARAVADKAGRDLANRLLRAVITLKGSK